MNVLRGIAVGTAAALLAAAGACGGGSQTGTDSGHDAGPIDTGLADAGAVDGAGSDARAGSVPDYTLVGPAPPGVTYNGKVVISPAAILFVKAGDTAQLTATAFDAAGAPVSGAVTWTSSRPSDVTVDASGLVTSVADIGSAQITAQIGTRVSAPILVAVVDAYPGTQLVTDAQIVSGPDLVDPTAAIQPGVQMTAKVTGIPALQPGTLLVAKEGKHLAGRVVSATMAADGQTVLLQTVALLDLFQRMDIQTDTLIDEAALVAAEHEAQPPPAGAANDPGFGFTQTQSALLGQSFVCELSAGSAGLLTLDANTRVVPELHAITQFTKTDEGDWDVLQAEVIGIVTATGTVTARIAPGVQIQGSCTLLIKEIPVPLGGPLALFASAEIPLGLAGRFKAQVTVGGFQLGLELTSTGHTSEGFYYTRATGLTVVHDQGIDFSMKPKASFPLTMVPVTTQVEVALGGFTGLDFRVLTADLSLLRVLFLGKVSGDFAPVDTQLDDTMYSSKYSIVPVIEAGPGETVATVLSWFGGLVKVNPAVSLELTQFGAKSPTGQFTTSKMSANIGDSVDLTVKLDADSIKFVGVDNVQKVRIYQSSRASTIQRIVAADLGASPGQTDFQWTWHPGPEDVGITKFWAVVVTTLGPGIELEIADDTTLPITVGKPGGWTGTVTWTITGNSSTTVSDNTATQTDTYTASGSGMMNVHVDASNVGVVDTVEESYHWNWEQDIQNATNDGLCMRTITQTSVNTLDGATSDTTSALFYFLDNFDGTATVVASGPIGDTNGQSTLDANEADSGTGPNCTSTSQHTNIPASGQLPSVDMMVNTPISGGVASGSRTAHSEDPSGGSPPLDIEFNWNLTKT